MQQRLLLARILVLPVNGTEPLLISKTHNTAELRDEEEWRKGLGFVEATITRQGQWTFNVTAVKCPGKLKSQLAFDVTSEAEFKTKVRHAKFMCKYAHVLRTHPLPPPAVCRENLERCLASTNEGPQDLQLSIAVSSSK